MAQIRSFEIRSSTGGYPARYDEFGNGGFSLGGFGPLGKNQSNEGYLFLDVVLERKNQTVTKSTGISALSGANTGSTVGTSTDVSFVIPEQKITIHSNSPTNNAKMEVLAGNKVRFTALEWAAYEVRLLVPYRLR
jgi:hypothetical protein